MHKKLLPHVLRRMHHSGKKDKLMLCFFHYQRPCTSDFKNILSNLCWDFLFYNVTLQLRVYYKRRVIYRVKTQVIIPYPPPTAGGNLH